MLKWVKKQDAATIDAINALPGKVQDLEANLVAIAHDVASIVKDIIDIKKQIEEIIKK